MITYCFHTLCLIVHTNEVVVKMKILAMDRYLDGTTLEKVQAYLEDEMKIAWKNYKKGYVREWYSRQDKPGVVLMLECESLNEAQNLVDELPLVNKGLIAFDLIPLGPFEPLGLLLK